MHWLTKLILHAAGNAFALYLANRYVPGFVVNNNLLQLTIIALVLAFLNFLLKPILTLVLGPLIVLTLGLGALLVNAIILWLLPVVADKIDFLRGSITIQTIPALLITTLIVTAVNFVVHLIS